MKFLMLLLTAVFVCFLLIAPQISQVLWSHIDTLPATAGAAVTDPNVIAAREVFSEPNPPSSGNENSLVEFAVSVRNGHTDELVGVYAPGIFAMRVEQQPLGRFDYVSSVPDTITEFALPRNFGAVGLLAHNTLSGSTFFQLIPGQDIVLVYGDGILERYRVVGSQSFQALDPTSPFSQFVDLANPTSSPLSSGDLFNQIYTKRDTLIFQTCIEAEGDPSWGRIFITAERVDPLQLGVPDLTITDNQN